MGNTKRKNKKKKKEWKNNKKKKQFNFTNELSFVFFFLLSMTEMLQEQTVLFLNIDIKYYFYVILFINVVRSLYKYLKYKDIIKKVKDEEKDEE